MLTSKISGVEIAGISVAVPSQTTPIDSFESLFGKEGVTKFSQMTGVKSVRRASPRQTASDLAFEAATDLFVNAGIDKNEIGQLLFVTQKPDYRSPASSFILHKRLGLNKLCSCADINLACSGFIFALHSAMTSLKYSTANYALVLTGDTSARTISPLDRSMIMLFGDSGTATLVRKTKNEVNTHFAFRTDGKRFKAIITPAGAYRNIGLPMEPEVWGDEITRSDYDTHMKGMDVFGFSITDVPKLISELMNDLGTTSADYDYFALHQANMYILKQISRKIKIPSEKLLVSLDRFGNNSSNSVPLTLADHFGNIHNGTLRVFMSGFGAGLSWGCCDTLINRHYINPIVYTDNYLDD